MAAEAAILRTITNLRHVGTGWALSSLSRIESIRDPDKG